MLALAPDSASAQAARKLSSPARWPTLNAGSESLWGECQGSGSQPYLVGIDLRTPEYACKCSCPSRKFPCKHGLALLLLHVARQQGAGQQRAGQGSWGAATPPEVLGNGWKAGGRVMGQLDRTVFIQNSPRLPKPWTRRQKRNVRPPVTQKLAAAWKTCTCGCRT